MYEIFYLIAAVAFFFIARTAVLKFKYNSSLGVNKLQSNKFEKPLVKKSFFETRERGVFVSEIKKLQNENRELRLQLEEKKLEAKKLDEALALVERDSSKRAWEEDFKQIEFVNNVRGLNAKSNKEN